MKNKLPLVIEVRAYNNHISLPINIINSLKLTKNDVILYRLLENKDVLSVGKVVKTVRKKNNIKSYLLSIPKETREKINLKLPQTIKIKILDIKKKGHKPLLKVDGKGCIDVISLIPDDQKFTCFEKPNNMLLIYYINNRATSIATMPRHIKLDGFTLWNIGFYISEGLKTNFHRVSASNNDSNLVSRFVNYLNFWNVQDNEIFVDIKLKPENYDIALKKFWSNKLDISAKRIKLRKSINKPTNSQYGNAEVTVYNTVLGIIHSKFLNYIISNANKFIKKQALSIIKGLEDGDGHVMLHNGSIEIGITCAKMFTEFVKNLYSKIYSKPTIEPHSTSKKVDKVIYRGIKNALKFLENGHFVYSLYRRKN